MVQILYVVREYEITLYILSPSLRCRHFSFTFVTVKQSQAQTVSQPAVSKPDWTEFDQSVAELRDWLTLLERMLKSQRVTVGDVEEIEQMVLKHKVSA